MNNLTFQEKRRISRQIADIAYIDTYRRMLRQFGDPGYGIRMADRQKLAESLVYNLLEYCTPEVIKESISKAPAPAVSSTEAPARKTSKKKVSLKNTATSAGMKWRTRSSARQTASTPKESICTTSSEPLKEKLKASMQTFGNWLKSSRNR